MSLKAGKSFIWNFYQPGEDRFAKCNICKKNVSYKTTISNLKKHFERMHPSIKVTEEKQVSSLAMSQAPVVSIEVQEAPRPSTSTSDGPINSAATYSSSATRPSKISDYLKRRMTGVEKKKTLECFLKLFYLDLQPFKITEDRGFREFVNALNPNFEIPTRTTVSKSLLPVTYARCLQNTKEALAKVKAICLTTDAWTSINNESFIAVTGHFIDDDFEVRKVLLKCCATDERHTAENLATDFQNVLSEWGLTGKVNLVVTDNASNIVSAIKDRLMLRHLGCFGHTINLIVKDALSQTFEVSALITRVKGLVSLFKRSTVAMNKLIDCQKKIGMEPKKILQDVVTRWNSTYYMLKRFVELEEAIRSVMGLLDLSSVEHLSSTDWAILKELLKVLSPFEAATKCTSGEKHMTASMVIMVTNGLVDVASSLSKEIVQKPVKKVLDNLMEGLDTRLGNVEHSRSLSCATFLDPRMKLQAFKSTTAADTVKNTIISLVTAEIQSVLREREPATEAAPQSQAEQLSIFHFFKKKVAQEAHSHKGTSRARAIMEVQRYLEDEFVPLENDPSVWWRNNWRNYPNLCKLVQAKCCAVATSVPCERLFSKASNILSERRTRLSSSKVSQLLFLSENHTFLD